MPLILPTSIVKEWAAGDSYSVDNTPTGGNLVYVQKAPGNTQYEEVLAWIAAGNTPDPEYTPAEQLDLNRALEIEEIKLEGITRIAAVVPELDTFEELGLLKVLWPFLNAPGADPDLALVRDIYLYGRTKIVQAQGATQAQLDAYDAATDPGWPT